MCIHDWNDDMTDIHEYVMYGMLTCPISHSVPCSTMHYEVNCRNTYVGDQDWFSSTTWEGGYIVFGISFCGRWYFIPLSSATPFDSVSKSIMSTWCMFLLPCRNDWVNVDRWKGRNFIWWKRWWCKNFSVWSASPILCFWLLASWVGWSGE